MQSRLDLRRARLALTAIAAVLAAVCTTGSALAAERRPPPGPWHGDIHRFHEHDWNVWRGGHWSHARHNGRMGWWWVTGGLWYFYPAPVYPYPSPWEPPAVDLVSPPMAGAPPPPTTQVWYFCEASNAYYPYVATCPGGWKQVPATP